MRVRINRILTLVLAVCMLIAIPANNAAAASKTINLNRTSITLTEKNTTQLKALVNGKAVSAKWSTSNSKVASVSTTGKILAKSAGTATITANINGVRKNCKVTVMSAFTERALKLVKGRWYRNSSEYLGKYYCFQYGYFCEYNERSGKLIRKQKVQSVVKKNTRYTIIMSSSVKYEFEYIKGRKVTDIWYCEKSNGEWKYSGSDSWSNR